MKVEHGQTWQRCGEYNMMWTVNNKYGDMTSSVNYIYQKNQWDRFVVPLVKCQYVIIFKKNCKKSQPICDKNLMQNVELY